MIALTTNIAIRENRRIEFKPEWFEIDSDETPEGHQAAMSNAGREGGIPPAASQPVTPRGCNPWA